jgi:hypothetical protein
LIILQQVFPNHYCGCRWRNSVIPFNFESPNHTNTQLIIDPANSVSPFGWHDINGVNGAEYTIKGNNVWAKDDFLGTNKDDGSSQRGDNRWCLIFLMEEQMSRRHRISTQQYEFILHE